MVLGRKTARRKYVFGKEGTLKIRKRVSHKIKEIKEEKCGKEILETCFFLAFLKAQKMELLVFYCKNS